MGIYIKGMEMPKNCDALLHIHKDGKAVLYPFDGENQPTEYQALSVPKHGRLIDADAPTFPTPHRKESNDYMKGWNACLRSVTQQPTIFPAEEGEET